MYALFLAPTRELAFQIHEVVQALGSGIGADCVCIVGGVDSTGQSIALALPFNHPSMVSFLNPVCLLNSQCLQ